MVSKPSAIFLVVNVFVIFLVVNVFVIFLVANVFIIELIKRLNGKDYMQRIIMINIGNT